LRRKFQRSARCRSSFANYVPKKKKQTAEGAGRGSSKKKNGARMNDVSADTIAKRLSEFPNDKLKVIAGQLWCNVCKCNVGSGKQSVVRHCTQTAKHTAGAV